MAIIKNLDDLRAYIPAGGGNLDNRKTFRHIAIIFKGNKVLAIATNQIGSRSFGCGYNLLTLHAEVAAIKKVGDVRLLDGTTMYVFRLGKGSNDCFMNSEPCRNCRKLLTKCMREHGLSRVFYSAGNGPTQTADTPANKRKPWNYTVA